MKKIMIFLCLVALSAAAAIDDNKQKIAKIDFEANNEVKDSEVKDLEGAEQFGIGFGLGFGYPSYGGYYGGYNRPYSGYGNYYGHRHYGHGYGYRRPYSYYY